MNVSKAKQSIISIIPGLIVCYIIALVSKYLATFVPALGAATIAIFLGMLLGNTILNQKILDQGTKFSEGTLLSISVVLLGSTLSITTIMTLGIRGIVFIALQMIITILAVIWLGRKMKFEDDFTLLMASGNAVCGSSAIASTVPAIGASDLHKGISITLVNVTGTVLMLLLPIISYLLFGLENLQTSALIGGTLQSVGQVVASAKMISPEVTELATIFKIVRIIFLVFVVIYLGYVKNKSSIEDVPIEDIEEVALGESVPKERKLKIKVPWYVIGFFIACALFTLGLIPINVSHFLKSVSNNFEIIALAAIGMRVKIRELILHGAKYSSFAALIGIIQVVVALTLIFVLL